MRAVLMREFGGPEVLEMTEIEKPRPGPDEVAVAVGAVATSRTRDVAVRSGDHPFSRQVDLPHVLGGEFAGVVEAIGPGVEESLLGARVSASAAHSCGKCEACLVGAPDRCSAIRLIGIHRPGSYAESVVVGTEVVTRVPDGVSLVEAAAMAADGPIAFAQLDVTGVGPGTPLAVTGATGALGTTLLALAGRLGASAVGLSRRPAEIPQSLELAARLDSADPGLGERLLGLTDGIGIEVVADNVGAPDVFARYLNALAVGGRVVVSGAIGHPQLPVLPVPARTLYSKSISLIGVRTKRAGDADRFWDLVAAGFRLPDGLIETMPLEAVREAHTRIAAGTHTGNIVLTL